MEAFIDKWLYADAGGSGRFSATMNSSDLIPEPGGWNNGKGIALADMLSAKLSRDFPDRRFLAFVKDGADFGVSFQQV